jgi:hypothetical protein
LADNPDSIEAALPVPGHVRYNDPADEHGDIEITAPLTPSETQERLEAMADLADQLKTGARKYAALSGLRSSHRNCAGDAVGLFLGANEDIAENYGFLGDGVITTPGTAAENYDKAVEAGEITPQEPRKPPDNKPASNSGKKGGKK